MKWIGRPQSKNITDMTGVTQFSVAWASYNSNAVESDIVIFPDGNYFIQVPLTSTTIQIILITRDKKFTFTEGHKKAVREILKKTLFSGKMIETDGGGMEVEEFFRAFLMNSNG